MTLTTKRLGLIVALILGAAFWVAPSIAGASVTTNAPATVRPLNTWDGFDQYFVNEDHTSDCARIDAPEHGASEGALIIGTGDCTGFFGTPIDIDGPYELQLYSNPSKCLFWDKTGARDGIPNSFDLSGCSISSGADIWFSTSGSGYTQWFTTDNTTDSMWARVGTGTSNPAYENNMDGTNLRDHWTAIDAG